MEDEFDEMAEAEEYVRSLRDRGQQCVDELARCGMYVEHDDVAATPDGIVLVLDAELGDVAFSTRVQDPTQDGIDDEFRSMLVQQGNDEWLDNRNRIERALREGQDPIDL